MKKQVKRVVAGLLAVLLVIPFLAFGASADTDFPADKSSLWFNVLDYSYVGNQGNINFSYLSEKTNRIYFNLPSQIDFFYDIDMVVEIWAAVPSHVYYVSQHIGKVELSVDNIHGNTYRIYGLNIQCNGSRQTLEIEFDQAVPGAWINVYKCEILRVNLSDYGIDATGALSYGNNRYTFTYDASNHEANKNVSFYGSGSTYDFVTYITFSESEWKKYDFIDVKLLVATQIINSISATCDGNLPLSVNKIECTDRAGNWIVSLRVDLRDVRRTTNDYPMISITGSVKTGNTSSNLFAFISASGFIDIPAVSPLFVYFSRLSDWLTTGFSSVSKAIADNFTSHFDDLHGWINDSTDAIVDAITGGGEDASSSLSDAENQQNSINSGVATINGVSKPQVSSGDLDISGYVGGFAHFGTILSIPLNNSSVIFTVFMITFVLMMGAYILFGKRG